MLVLVPIIYEGNYSPSLGRHSAVRLVSLAEEAVREERLGSYCAQDAQYEQTRN